MRKLSQTKKKFGIHINETSETDNLDCTQWGCLSKTTKSKKTKRLHTQYKKKKGEGERHTYTVSKTVFDL